MSRRKALSQWEQTVSSHLPHLSRPQAHVLALWSDGMVLARIVWHDERGRSAGRVDGVIMLNGAPTIARVVL